MLTGVHFLLSYACTNECDHCFVYCSPSAKGTFTLAQVKAALNQIKEVESVNTVYFEGGEPFLFYPLMLESIKLAHQMGFNIGIVSNSYWATNQEDAELWLKPLKQYNITDLSLSDDAFHSGDMPENLAKHSLAAAEKLGFPVGAICIENPADQAKESDDPKFDILFKGRAVATLSKDLPTKPWDTFTECPSEDFEDPGRVHLDPFGNVHMCQGILMGNIWETPLSEIVKNYNGKTHPICAPLIAGGPAELTREFDIPHEERYVDACHLCFLTRIALLDKFPQYLAPKQVYGLDDD
jgi:MoaA/NifB/PqqE/SkfB family radical SAM enzyme